MGLTMSPGSVIQQLDEMNAQLGLVTSNAGTLWGKISAFGATAGALVGKTYDSVRTLYANNHAPLVQGIRAYAQALINDNNAYKKCISSYLSGIGYVDEDALERDRVSINNQISYVQNVVIAERGSYSTYLGCLEQALNLVEKKLQQISDFKAASAGLYQGMDGYSAVIKGEMAVINGMGQYNVSRLRAVRNLNTAGAVELVLNKVGNAIRNKELIDIENVSCMLSYQAAQLAGLRVNSSGLPIINSGTEARAYYNALSVLRDAEVMALPEDVSGRVKRYEDYQMLTDQTSNQYALQQIAITDERGFRRIKVEGLDQPAYMVAMASYYTDYDSTGVVFAVTLENGNTFYCVAGDMKDDQHTNPETHQYTYLPDGDITEENADIIEFIMDIENPYARELLPPSQGGMGYGILNYSDTYSDMDSPIVEIKKLDIDPVLCGNE